ncbi:hypothetical protein DL93DRAFT_2153530 [Clavulina sp. PMI_390]|nr:hypothetical protein DL93DRAFT_2153530 [Clavulina sp. PMI_390]
MGASNEIWIDARDYPVVEMTVHRPDRAIVQRRFTISMQAGQNNVVIRNLPSMLDGNSIGIEAETVSYSQALTIFDVVYVAPNTGAIRNHGSVMLNDTHTAGPHDGRTFEVVGDEYRDPPMLGSGVTVVLLAQEAGPINLILSYAVRCATCLCPDETSTNVSSDYYCETGRD